MFVTSDDFRLKPYDIPNLSQVPNSFPPFIEREEEKVLKELLGVQFYNDFIAGLDALPPDWDVALTYAIDAQVVYGVSIWKALAENVGVTPVEGTDWTKVEENIWLKLQNGFTFSIGSIQYEYKGLVSMLVPFIWYQWTRATFDSNTGIGIVESKAENSEKKEPKRRLVDAWNDYAGQTEYLAAFIQMSNTPDVVYENYYYYWVEAIPLNTLGI